MTSRFRIAGVPEHFNLPWKLALADDAFANKGLQVEFVDYPGGTGVMTQALRDHDLEAAVVLTEGAVLDILQGSDNRLVSVFVDSPLVWGIHVAGSGDICAVGNIGGREFRQTHQHKLRNRVGRRDTISEGCPLEPGFRSPCRSP